MATCCNLILGWLLWIHFKIINVTKINSLSPSWFDKEFVKFLTILIFTFLLHVEFTFCHKLAGKVFFFIFFSIFKTYPIHFKVPWKSISLISWITLIQLEYLNLDLCWESHYFICFSSKVLYKYSFISHLQSWS